MLLEILWSLERLATEVAFVRLKRHMNAHVRGDVVALHGGCATSSPLTGEVEIVRRLATNMALADMVLEEMSAFVLDITHGHVDCLIDAYVESFRRLAAFATAGPLASEKVVEWILQILRRLCSDVGHNILLVVRRCLRHALHFF